MASLSSELIHYFRGHVLTNKTPLAQAMSFETTPFANLHLMNSFSIEGNWGTGHVEVAL